MFISGEPADLGLAHAAGLVGADRILFASDWPHMDGAWPDPLVIVRDRTDLTDEQKRAVLVEGPAAYYGIELPALLAHLGDDWSADARIADIDGLLPPDYRPAPPHEAVSAS
jgi:Amidohydrolase